MNKIRTAIIIAMLFAFPLVIGILACFIPDADRANVFASVAVAVTTLELAGIAVY